MFVNPSPPETAARGVRIRTSLALGLAVAVAYVLVGHLGLELAHYQERATIIWAPSGLAIAATWRFGNRVLWAVFLGAFVTNALVSPALVLSALIALGNTAEAFVGALLMRRLNLSGGFRGAREVLVYLATVVFGATMIAALNGVTWLVLIDGLPLSEAWLTAIVWWLGDVGGVLVVTTLLLAWRHGPRLRTQRVAPGLIALTAIAAAGIGVGPWVGDSSAEIAAGASVLCLVLPYPAAAWAAIAHGLRGASAVTAIIALAAVGGTAAGAGPLQSGHAHLDIVSLWPMLATLSASAMLLAIGVEERLRAEQRRVALESELRRVRSLGELGLLAGGVAHDFNNLLAVVQANAKMLEGRGLSVIDDECVADIVEAAARGQELSEQLMAYAACRPLARRRVDLGQLAGETARLLTPHRPRGVDVSVRAEPGVEVIGDPVRLRQLLMNLVVNAFDAMEDRRGLVEIEVRRQAERVVLTVSDEGVGIAPEVAARIFEPFFSTKDEGRGLGLVAVAAIARDHDGSVRVLERPGQRGAAFSIELPGAPIATQPAMIPEPERAATPEAA